METWQTVVSETPHDANWLVIRLASDDDPDPLAFDIGIGPAACERIIILRGMRVGFTTIEGGWWNTAVPLTIPKASRIAVRGVDARALGIHLCPINIPQS